MGDDASISKLISQVSDDTSIDRLVSQTSTDSTLTDRLIGQTSELIKVANYLIDEDSNGENKGFIYLNKIISIRTKLTSILVRLNNDNDTSGFIGEVEESIYLLGKIKFKIEGQLQVEDPEESFKLQKKESGMSGIVIGMIIFGVIFLILICLGVYYYVYVYRPKMLRGGIPE
jgi:hypothetical protein